MEIRNTMLAAGIALAAALPGPALAGEAEAGDLAERLNDPATQYAVAGMLSAMSKAVLDMRIAPFAEAMEGMNGRPMRDLPPDATVGDVSGLTQDRVRSKLIEHVPPMMSAMGGMAAALEDMLPELEAMAERMKDAVPAR